MLQDLAQGCKELPSSQAKPAVSGARVCQPLAEATLCERHHVCCADSLCVVLLVQVPSVSSSSSGSADIHTANGSKDIEPVVFEVSMLALAGWRHLQARPSRLIGLRVVCVCVCTLVTPGS